MPSQAEAWSSPSSSMSSSSGSRITRRRGGCLVPNPAAKAIVTTVARPNTSAATNSAMPESGAPKIIAGARSSASPNTPPNPVGSGQEPMRGSVETKAAARNVARIHSRPRHLSPTGRCDSSRQPSSISGSSSMMAARPSNCIAKSEKIAPGKPSRLCAGLCVAWLSEGSCTDQVASAMAPSSASVISARPASSLRRRRRMSRKCSETKARTSRLRSIAGIGFPYPSTATRRWSASAVVVLS